MKQHGGKSSGTIPVAGPSITQAEIDAVSNAVATSWYDNVGTDVSAFEREFAASVGRRFAAAVPNCTAAIHLAALGLNLQPGDEVVLPDATWIASAVPFTYVGADIVFADVDPNTWVLTRETVEPVLTERTRAVVAVDLYGSMPNYDELRALCDKRGIALIEDAAEASGSKWNGTPAGSFGVCSVFSFHGSKTMVTDEGGMFVTDDEALFDRINFLRDHGRRIGDRSFFHEQIAYKYKMSSLQAALGRVQLSRLDELVTMKRQLFSWYEERLGDLPLHLNAEPTGVYNSYWMITAVLDADLGISKEQLAERLKEADIASRPFFYPLSELPAFGAHPKAGTAKAERPEAFRLGTYGINLPSALVLEESDVDYVCDIISKVVNPS